MTGVQRIVAWFPAALPLLFVVLLSIAWPTLPESVVVHFSVDAGKATGETSKLRFAIQGLAALAMPVLSMPILLRSRDRRVRLVVHALCYGLTSGTLWVLWAIVKHNQGAGAAPKPSEALTIVLVGSAVGAAVAALTAGERRS